MHLIALLSKPFFIELWAMLIEISLCCDRKSRAAYAQSFALWQQATIEFTCHDHSIIVCSCHIYVWCCSSRTSRSWWITQSTQHHRRGCNNSLSAPYNFRRLSCSLCLLTADERRPITTQFCNVYPNVFDTDPYSQRNQGGDRAIAHPEILIIVPLRRIVQ